MESSDPSGRLDPERSTADPVSPDAVGRLSFGRYQYGILAGLVALVVVIAALGYESYRSLEQRTQALNTQLQLVSNNITSYEREVLTYGLVAERWAAGQVDDEELALARALLERQRRVNETLADPVLRSAADDLNARLETLDALMAGARPPATGSPEHQRLTEAVDEMSSTAKDLFDATERVNAVLVFDLLDGLQDLRRLELWAALLAAILVVALVLSLREMIRSNYALARQALADEHRQHQLVRRQRANAESRYREIVDEVTDVVFRISSEGRWTLLNKSWEVLTGIPVDDSLHAPVTEAWSSADQEKIGEMVDRLLSGSDDHAYLEARLVHAEGKERQVVLRAKAIVDPQSDQIYLSGTMSDVTDRNRAQRLSTAQSQILEMVANELPLPRILDQIVDHLRPLARPGTRLRLVTADDEAAPDCTGRTLLTDRATGEEIGAVEWTLLDVTTDGDAHGDSDRDTVEIVEIAGRLGQTAIERHRAALLTAHRATHDSLTGLPNRTLLADRITMAIERTARSSRRFAVLFLDVDRFKLVNDSLGHPAGDGLLEHMAATLTATVRDGDTVARFGGDEFVVLLEDLDDADQAVMTAKRILEAAADPVDIGEHQVRATLSIGVVYGDRSSTVDDLLKHADIAMYRAKQEGRSRYKVFDASLRRWADRQHELSLAIQGAIERDEMELWYQPVVNLRTGVVRGFEALSRWRRPSHGLVPPDHFLELIEDLGLIADLGLWVLRTALDQARRWHETSPDVFVAVNVSGRELVQPGYAERVAEALEVSQVRPDLLLLEITEVVLIEDTEPVRQCMRQLKELGVKVAIDDFGTGYSSLQYLRQLDVDRLKIDKMFISSGDSDLHDPTIVSSIAELSRALGLEVVAEGVETSDQVKGLLDLGVEVGQGYFFGHPSPAESIEISHPARTSPLPRP